MEDNIQLENLEIWEEAVKIRNEVDNVLHECDNEEFRNEIQRTLTSLTSLIEKGHKHNVYKEKSNHLFAAKGSCGELCSLLHFAIKLEYFNSKIGMELIEQSRELGAKIYEYIQSLKKRF